MDSCPYKLSSTDTLSCVVRGCLNHELLGIVTTQFCSRDFGIMDAIETAIAVFSADHPQQNKITE